MSDSESDEDLKRAIALSLRQDVATSPRQPVIIDLVSSDDEDDDLDAPVSTKRIIPKSPPAELEAGIVTRDSSAPPVKEGITSDQGGDQRYQFAKPPLANSDIPGTTTQSTEASQTQTLGSSFLGLNRKQMEEERRLRVNQRSKIEENLAGTSQQRKRKLLDSPPLQDSRHVRAKASGIASFRDKMHSGTRSESLASKESAANPRVLSFRDQQALNSTGIQYPQGAVKKTWVYGCPREGDDIRIEEVFQKDDLELAVLSAFQVDPTWLETKLNLTTKVIWVLQAKSEAEKANFRSGASKNYGFCFPNMDGNINFPYDWGETGVMENLCYLIDLPRLPEGKALESDQLTDFGKELFHFVKAMGLHDKIINSILKFDFSHTSHIQFVHSIGGSHSGFDWKRTGYPGLGRGVHNLGLQTKEAISVHFITASVGNINDSFVKAIYLAAKGDNGLTEFEWRTNKILKGKSVSSAEKNLSEELKDRFKIYFPTRETVAQSKGGEGAGGTICFHPKWYNSESFPKHLMRDCMSKRKGILTHTKLLLATGSSKTWAYVGSANLSESAWGRLVKDKTTKEPKLNCRNWECGVLVPFHADNLPDQPPGDSTSRSSPGVSHGKIPIPILIPGEEYGARRPWFYEDR